MTYFLKKLCCFFIYIFRKCLCNFQIFKRSVFRWMVLRPFVFYLFEVQSTVLVSSPPQGEKEVIFNFAVSLQNGKGCVCIKYLTLVRPRKLIPVNFVFLYSIQNAQNSSIAKKLFISQFFKQIKLCHFPFHTFSTKNFSYVLFI